MLNSCKIFLSGGITGLDTKECKKWRDCLQSRFHGVFGLNTNIIVNQMRHFNPNKETSDINKDRDSEKIKNDSSSRKITVIVNGKPVILDKKSKYVFVDIFDKIDFDLSKPKGNIVTTKNGQEAEYMEEIHDGDVIEVFWENK